MLKRICKHFCQLDILAFVHLKMQFFTFLGLLRP